MINNVKKGISIIILATLFFAIMDGVSRYLAETYNVFVINMIRSWVLALFVILISLRKKNGIKKVLYSQQPILQFIRGLLLTLAKNNVARIIVDIPFLTLLIMKMMTL